MIRVFVHQRGCGFVLQRPADATCTCEPDRFEVSYSTWRSSRDESK